MDVQEFKVPDFLSGNSTEEIHEAMLEQLPENMDKTEGGIPWDLTYPTALVVSEVVEFVLTEAIKNMFPMWAEGEMLDYHGQNRGMARKTAEQATGSVKIIGTANYVIEEGTVLSTTGVDEDETVLFQTVEEATIGEDGSVMVGIIAVEAGTVGNVAVGRINRLDIPDENILSVENIEAVSGGLDEEDDDDYRERLMEYDQSQGESYIGSVADYKRWAMSVNGVGNATIIPAEDTSGTVKIVLMGVDNRPASSELCEEVYNYIMKPDSPSERLAPINAVLDVKAPASAKISISAKIVLDNSRTLEAVVNDFVGRVNEYYIEAMDEGKIIYSRIGSILIGTEGVADYSNLTINNATENIVINNEMYPVSSSDLVVLVV